MNYFIDTSALIKRYINEKGSNVVDSIFREGASIFVSEISKIEAISTIKRLLVTNNIDLANYSSIKRELLFDFTLFNIIEHNNDILEMAIKMIEKYQLKTLDSIQLASCLSQFSAIDFFVGSDKKLIKSAKNENMKILDPMDDTNYRGIN